MLSNLTINYYSFLIVSLRKITSVNGILSHTAHMIHSQSVTFSVIPCHLGLSLLSCPGEALSSWTHSNYVKDEDEQECAIGRSSLCRAILRDKRITSRREITLSSYRITWVLQGPYPVFSPSTSSSVRSLRGTVIPIRECLQDRAWSWSIALM